MIDIQIFDTPEEIAAAAAELAAQSLQQALKVQSQATFVLAGGRLPPMANDILADKYSKAFDWRRVLFLIGDERCVALDDPQSSWLSALPMFDAHPEIPPEHKLRPSSDLLPEAAADDYNKTLLKLPTNQSGLPLLNHLWFGIGEDGHTLSLFPNHSSSNMSRDTTNLVIPVHDSPKPPPNRISFSYQALKGVLSAVAFISGSSKASVIAQIANGDHSLPIVIASQTIAKSGGQVTWLLDKEAVSQIPPDQTIQII